MIHNAIQVFYTKSKQLGHNFFGFPEIRYFNMSAFLSLKCLKDKNYHVKLITDNLGKKYLIDILGLEYDEVSTELETLDINPALWGMSKIYAFSKQTKPFLYCDLDVFLFDDISKDLHKSYIFFQNHEQNYHFAYDTFIKHSKHFSKKTTTISAYEEDNNINYSYGDAYNTGLFGGNDIALIQNCCNEILEYSSQESFKNIIDTQEASKVSVFMEQVYFFYLLKTEYELHIPKLHINEVITERLDYYSQWRNSYVHLASKQKYNFRLLEELIKKVEPTVYFSMELHSWGLNSSSLLRMTNGMC